MGLFGIDIVDVVRDAGGLQDGTVSVANPRIPAFCCRDRWLHVHRLAVAVVSAATDDRHSGPRLGRPNGARECERVARSHFYLTELYSLPILSYSSIFHWPGETQHAAGVNERPFVI